MGKNKILKWIAPICLCATAMGLATTIPNSFVRAENISIEITTPSTTINAQRKQVSLHNEKLRKAITSMLGKKTTDTIYSDDFLNNEKFKADAENPVYQLDLSGTGVTDIRELVQFYIPSHIEGINLAGNGITKNHLSNIINVLDTDTETNKTITIDQDTSYESVTDFKTQIKKVNLNDNDIDLITINSSHLEDTRLLFGIQCFGDIHDSSFITLKDDNLNPYYFIRSNSDENYLSFSFTNALSTNEGASIKVRDTVTKLLNPDLLDTYSIKINSVPGSSTAYFKNYTFEREFTLFTLEIDPEFTIERKGYFDLKVNALGQILDGSPIIINGFGNNSSLFVSYGEGSTLDATSEKHKNEVKITISKDGKSRELTREYKVVDTISPVIILKGGDHVYSSKGKEYNDPGVIAYDPSVAGAKDGDDMSSRLIVESNVNVTVIGTYEIKYTVTDYAQNTTTVTRIVDIQEQVLDGITLKTTTKELVDGEDIILIVQPSDLGVDISKYKDITYHWYINDTLFQTTKGDSASGKSTITIIGDNSNPQSVYVKLVAKRVSDNATIELYSDRLSLDVKTSIDSNQTIIIASSIVILIILGGFITFSIIKYRKSKGKTHKKKSKSSKSKPSAKSDKKPGKKSKEKLEQTPDNKNEEIQVIKDFNGDSSSSNGIAAGYSLYESKDNNSEDNNN